MLPVDPYLRTSIALAREVNAEVPLLLDVQGTAVECLSFIEKSKGIAVVQCPTAGLPIDLETMGVIVDAVRDGRPLIMANIGPVLHVDLLPLLDAHIAAQVRMKFSTVTNSEFEFIRVGRVWQ